MARPLARYAPTALDPDAREAWACVQYDGRRISTLEAKRLAYARYVARVVLRVGPTRTRLWPPERIHG